MCLPAGPTRSPPIPHPSDQTEPSALPSKGGRPDNPRLDPQPILSSRPRAEGLGFNIVLADAGYRVSADFRHGHNAWGLRWAVGVVENQRAYVSDWPLLPVSPDLTASRSELRRC
ncbi:transposase [Methylobacterium sp. WCS2018Hpa-22]|uniref:transposase n=1 Tax=Methylobacterium sp. WCS2018Hpa-22 TaxID=3073633 RepID=UPI003862080B